MNIKNELKMFYCSTIGLLRTRDNYGYMQERYVTHHEENPDKIFYVIRRSGQGGGLLSNFHHVLGHVCIAEQNGWVPVVDMLNYDWMCGLDPRNKRSCNFWERLFRQPGGISLDEVSVSKHLILSSGCFPHQVLGKNFGFLRNSKTFYPISALARALFVLKPEPQKSIKSLLEVLDNPEKTIGVFSRGTDMVKAKGHSVLPSTPELIERTKHLMLKCCMNRVFLVTEEERVVRDFFSEFGDDLTFVNRPRVKAYEVCPSTPNYRHQRSDDYYLTSVEYLAEIIGLSMCGSFLGPIANGSAVALELNGGTYKEIEIVNKGMQY